MASNNITSSSDETNANFKFKNLLRDGEAITKSLFLSKSNSLPNINQHSSSYYPRSFSASQLFCSENIPQFTERIASNVITTNEFKQPNIDDIQKRIPDDEDKRRYPNIWSPHSPHASTSMYWILQYCDNDKDNLEHEIKNNENDEAKILIHKTNSHARFEHKKLLQAQAYYPPLRKQDHPKQPPQKVLDFFILCGRRRRRRIFHHIDDRLFIPFFRSRFLGKVMAVKAMKWFAATGITLGARYLSPTLSDYAKRHVWLISIPVFIYLGIFTIVRGCETHLSTFTCLCAIVCYTCCLAMIAFITFCTLSNALVPTVMITLSVSYFAMCILAVCVQMDVTKDSSISSVALLTMFFSLVAFIGVNKFLNIDEESFSIQIGTIWFPSFILTQCVSLMEMAEIKALLQGYSISFGLKDWVIVATLLG